MRGRANGKLWIIYVDCIDKSPLRKSSNFTLDGLPLRHCKICLRTAPNVSFVCVHISTSSTCLPWFGNRNNNISCFPLLALYKGTNVLSSQKSASHSITYSCKTLRTRHSLVVSCWNLLTESLPRSNMVIVSYDAFSLSMHDEMKSSWISTWLFCKCGPRFVNVSLSSSIALLAISSSLHQASHHI